MKMTINRWILLVFSILMVVTVFSVAKMHRSRHRVKLNAPKVIVLVGIWSMSLGAGIGMMFTDYQNRISHE